MTEPRTHGNKPFVVVGAGIGGIAAAVALGRQGIQVRVLEQESDIGELGAGIQLAPNALRVLDSLGALDSVYEQAVSPPAITMRDAKSGEVLTRLEIDSEFLGRYGYPYIVTHRSDLHAALVAAARATGMVEIQAGARVVGIVQPSSDQVEVTLESGTVIGAPAVVGADGLHSATREYVTGGDELVYAGDFAYRGTVPYDAIPEREGKDEVTWWVGPGMHLIQYPVRGGELYNQVAVITSKREGSDASAWGSVEELDERFADKHELVRQGVSLVGRERRWVMVDREPIQSWTRRRVALLGDAAHPMLQYLAQGACQALEDAAGLANSVGGNPDPEVAFKHYEGVRAPRSAEAQRWARLMGEIAHADGILANMRNELLRLRPARDFRQVEWLYAGGPAAGGK